MKDLPQELRDYALANYDEGGHWVYETHSDEDYSEVINRNHYDMDAAKRELKEYWELMHEREQEIQSLAF